MMIFNSVKLSEKVYLITINDRRTHLFENVWPLERGVSYNSYLIIDEKVALIDTSDGGFIEEYVETVKYLLGPDRKIDYLVVNHAEPDHSGVLKHIAKEYPEVQIVGNPMTFKFINQFYEVNGNNYVVKDGEKLSLGTHTLTFYATPWLHWPETMMTYDETDQILFSGDAFGSFGALDGGVFDNEIDLDYFESEMRRYYSCIVGKYTNQTQKALAKLSTLPVKTIGATHGPVFKTNPAWIVNKYMDWSSFKHDNGVVIVFSSMYGNTEKMADYIARKLREFGVYKIKIFDASKTHMSYIISEVWHNKALLLGSPTYNMDIHPALKSFLDELRHLEDKNHIVGIFGSYTWNCNAPKLIRQIVEQLKFELVHEPIEIKGAMKEADAQYFDQLARTVADRLLGVAEEAKA